MPNSFGNRPLLDPSKLLQECIDRDLPVFWHGEVTVAKCPPGREPGKASFLMRYGDVRQLDKSTDHTLSLSDGERSLDLKSWTILEAFAPVSGAATTLSDDTPYLVRAVDRRYHLRRSPFSQAYNVTTDGSTYVSSTTNSGTAWTWSGIFGSLWAKLPGPPAPPSLPFTPHGTPQNFSWFGCASAWNALNDLLDRLACIVCYDPVADLFTVERLGSADATAEAFEAKVKRTGYLTFDTLPVASERADKPESLKVVFRRYPAPSAGSDPTYSVTTSLGGTGVVTGTTVQIEDDACAIGSSGTPSNASYLASRAAERVDDFKRKLAGFDRRLIRSYIGVWKDAVAAPGSTYAGLAFEDRGQSYRTELQAKPDARLEEWRSAVPGVDSATSLTVKESDGSPSYSSVNSLEFDQDDGFSLSQPGAGRAKVNYGITVKESDGTPTYAPVNSLEFDQDEGYVVTQPGSKRAKVSRSSPENGWINTACTITTADTWTALGGGVMSPVLQGGRYMLNAAGMFVSMRFNTPYTGAGLMQFSFWDETSNAAIGTGPYVLAAYAAEVNGNLVMTCASDGIVVNISAGTQIAGRFLWTANGTGATFTSAASSGGTMTWVRLGP